MNRGVCNNLMRDCFPYLNATNLQGRNMLDMRRMKKFQKEKAKIVEKLAKLKRKIAEAEEEEDMEDIIDALEDYQEELQDAMRLRKEDFTGEGAEDFKFGFKMPLNCRNSTHCNWICQKMIKVDGVSDEAIAVSYTHLTLPTIYSV